MEGSGYFMLVGAGRQFGDIIWRRKRPKKGHL